MNLLVKNVIITDPQSQFNKQECDVRVVDGQIKNIGKLTAQEGETIFDASGACLTPGFFDLNCVAGDPGFETKEDLETLTAAAKSGGFTGLALLPQANPVVQSKSQVEYIINKTRNNLVDVLPVGAISQNREAKEIAELFDMQQAGAVAFSDGDRALQDDGFMSRALQYAKGLDALLMVYPENKSIAGKSQINESKNSVLLGMKGLPALAEEMHIARDIFLATYNETKIHISNISTAGAVALIRKAKKDGVQVSCDVTAHHLVFTEELLADFDSNYKVKPPLRGKADVKALIAGLKDGTIDAITSQHRPEEIEFKNVEFEIAHYGIIALQTVLPLLLKAGLDVGMIAEKLAINPRKLLNLNIPVIEEGTKANFTVFNPNEKWLYNSSSNFSKSANSPLLGTELIGKVILVYNNNQYKES
ncbi:dihydroorotase [Agrobacterium tumefaciens]|nr:dihydroorotase [Agrobacterium tumefaciens]NTE22972.1 dihydroorotase [Agrobacterium tumefaciens]